MIFLSLWLQQVHEHVDGILVKDGSKTMEELYDERMVSLLDPEGMA